MNKANELYTYQQDTIESFYEFHPEAFADLSAEEMDLLATYYFVGRPIDVDNIYLYTAKLRGSDKTIQKRAENVSRKVFSKLELDERSMNELLPDKR